MNGEGKMNSLSKRQINIKELRKYLKKLRVITIIVVIAGIILGSVFSVVSKKAMVEENVNSALQNVQNAKASLNTTDASDVESSYQSYLQLIKKKNACVEQNKSSILLNLDPNNSAGVVSNYLISGNKHAKKIMTSLSDDIMSDAVCNEISSKMTDKPQKAYIRELVEISDSESNDNSNNVTVNTNDNDSAALIKMQIYARNSKELSMMKSIVNVRINSLVKKYKATYGDFSFKLVDEKNDKITEDEVLKDNMNENSKLVNVVNLISTLKNSLSETEKNYFDALVAAGNTSQTNNVVTKIDPKLVATYGIGFGLIILIIYLILVIAKYMVSNKLHYASEMENLFDAELIADVDKHGDYDHVKKEFDFFVDLQKGYVGLTGTIESDEIQNVINALSNNQHVIVMPKELKTEADYENLAKVSDIVLVEKTEQSDVREINELVNYYRKKNIKVNGSIVID